MYIYFSFQGLILHQKQIIINILAIIYNYSYIELVKYVLIILRCPRTMHFIQSIIEVNNFKYMYVSNITKPCHLSIITVKLLYKHTLIIK